MTTARAGVVEQVTSVDTSRFLSGGSKTSSFSALVHWVDDPVVSWVSSDGSVGRIHQDDFVELECRVLVDPVGVQDSQVTKLLTDLLLGGDSQRLLCLQLVNTMVGWLTVSGTLVSDSLSVTSSDSHSVDHETLLGLVTQSSGLVWSGWSAGPVDDMSLSVFPTSDSQQESGDIRLLLSLQLLQVFVGTHCVLLVRDGGGKVFQTVSVFFRASMNLETCSTLRVTMRLGLLT